MKRTPRNPGTLHLRKRSVRAARLTEEPSGPVRAERGLQRGARAAAPRQEAAVRAEYPPARVREAGRTGASMPDHAPTADDAAPETLLDDDPSRTPHATQQRAPADSILQGSDRPAGLGAGSDEAEDAGRKPAGREFARQQKARARAHARDANSVEPHETEELAAAARSRRQSRR